MSGCWVFGVGVECFGVGVLGFWHRGGVFWVGVVWNLGGGLLSGWNVLLSACWVFGIGVKRFGVGVECFWYRGEVFWYRGEVFRCRGAVPWAGAEFWCRG